MKKNFKTPDTIKIKGRTYTHVDPNGILWRFDKGRPISILADQVMDDVGWPSKEA